MQFLREYLVAVQCFTRVPVRGAFADWTEHPPETLRAGSAHFPGVGWLVGLAACASFALVALLLHGSPFTPVVAATLSTIVTVLLTGAAAEAGLANVADGLGGGAALEEALAIMKDSRVGAYGALALALAVLLKVALIAVLAGQSEAGVLVALLAAHTTSRFAPLMTVRQLAYAGDPGLPSSGPLAQPLAGRELAIAIGWCVPPLLLALAVRGAAFVIMPLLLAALAWWLTKKLFDLRLQGFTREALGATQQICEIAFYLGAAIAWNFG